MTTLKHADPRFHAPVTPALCLWAAAGVAEAAHRAHLTTARGMGDSARPNRP